MSQQSLDPQHDTNSCEDIYSPLPEQLVGRADWLKKRGRIKDSELMYAAAAVIREWRRATTAKEQQP